ncbi:anti-sigma factor family protein [Thermodesulfobacteriota bacterium]
MECNEIRGMLDDYLDGYLSEEQQAIIISHLGTCRECSLAHEETLRFRQSLRNHEVPPSTDSFSENVFVTVINTHRRRKRKQAFYAFGSAVAACLVIWVVITATGILPGGSGMAPDMTLVMNEVKYIDVVFGSGSQLDEARLTVKVPDHLEIVGYQGIQELSWTTQIKKGKNYLTLPVRAVEAGKTVLEARVEHNKKTKTHTFHLLIHEQEMIEGRTEFRFAV